MNRMLGRTLAGIAMVGASTAFSSACVDGNSSLFIYGVMAPPTDAAASCTYEPSDSSLMLSSGVLDAAIRTSYEPAIMLGNQMTARASTEGRSETARIIIQGATVSVTDSAGNEVSNFTRLASGFLNPGATTTPALGAVFVTLIDPTTVADALKYLKPRVGSKRYVANVRVFGTTLGGNNVESDTFQYPVDICLGCRVIFPVEASDAARKAAECGRPNCAAAFEIGGCPAGQDNLVPCNACQGNPLCDPTYDPATNAVAPIRTTGDPEDCVADKACCEAAATP